MLHILEEVGTFINMVYKFPRRLKCRKLKEHDWYYYGGGWIFTAKYAFVCKRCGKRSASDMDELNKKGFKGIAKIK